MWTNVGNPNTLSVIKTNVLLFTFAHIFFESFTRDLNEAQAVYISEYYLICRFVIMMLRLRLKFRVKSLTINSHRGRAIMKREHLSPDKS